MLLCCCAVAAVLRALMASETSSSSDAKHRPVPCRVGGSKLRACRCPNRFRPVVVANCFVPSGNFINFKIYVYFEPFSLLPQAEPARNDAKWPQLWADIRSRRIDLVHLHAKGHEKGRQRSQCRFLCAHLHLKSATLSRCFDALGRCWGSCEFDFGAWGETGCFDVPE